MSAPGGGGELRAALRTFRRPLLVAAGLSALANLLLLTPTLYLLQVYDRVLASGNELTLVAVSLIAACLIAVVAAAEWARARWLVGAGLRLDNQLASRLFDAGFHARFHGEPGAPGRAFADLLQLRQFLCGPGLFALFDAPWAPLYVFVVYLLHPALGWLALGFVLLQALLAAYSHWRTAAPAEAAARAATDAQLFFRSRMRQWSVIESMGMALPLLERWRGLHARAVRAAQSLGAGQSNVGAASRLLRYLQQSLALAAAALLVIRGELSPGEMIAVTVLLTRALAPIDQLSTSWRGLVTAWAAYGRLRALLARFGPAEAAPRERVPGGDLSLRGLLATAPDRAAPILRGIDLELPAGTTLAVVGPSGSGKSTLLRAILGIWPDVAGEVLLGGVPVQAWDRAQLGPRLGYLPQDMQLLDGTIAENIARFGPVDAPRVIEAATRAGLHEMVLRLPQGYDTPLGEAAVRLSGGQRQRIALARAIYGRPSLVVLDEPNAFLDDAGEAALVGTLGQLKAEGATVVMATHRTSLVDCADWLLLLQQGRAVACGPRELVLARLRLRQVHPAAPNPVPRPA